MSRKDAIRDGGVAVVFVGTLVLALSLVWVVLCGADVTGPCIGTPFQGRQGALEFLGAVLLVVGLVLILLGRSAGSGPPAPASGDP